MIIVTYKKNQLNSNTTKKIDTIITSLVKLSTVARRVNRRSQVLISL